jgi:2-dehydropantoate 2-reductase
MSFGKDDSPRRDFFMDDKLKILSFGAGAIGTYIGGSLALAGHDVVFVEQPAVAEALQQSGMKLDLRIDPRRGENGIFSLHAPATAFEPSLERALARGPFDAALFALKSYDTVLALEGMRNLAAWLPPILCLQNGVDNEPAIVAALGKGKVIYGTVTSAIGRLAAGNVVLEKLRGLGIAAGHPLSEKLVATLDAAFLNTRLYPHAADMKWSKMLTNLVANASSAILDMTAREIFSNTGLFRMEMRMLRETLAVMAALGIKVVDLPGTPVRALAIGTRLPGIISRPFMVKAIGGGRGGKMPSFHIDLQAGHGKSEVDYLNGAVVRAGEKAGISTPVNRMLTDTLLALTRGNIGQEAFSHQPEKLLALIPAG